MAQRGFLPPDGVRCDQASEAAVKAALLRVDSEAENRISPTLDQRLVPGPTTSPSVIDVLEQRLTVGPILEGLRLPYIKAAAASPNRSTASAKS